MLSGDRLMGVLGWQHGTYRPLFPIFEGMYSVPTVFITIIFLPAHHPSVILLSPHYPTHGAESTNHASMGISRCSPLLTPKDSPQGHNCLYLKSSNFYLNQASVSFSLSLSLSLSSLSFTLSIHLSFSFSHTTPTSGKSTGTVLST